MTGQRVIDYSTRAGVAVVTGGSGGLGAAAARQLADAGSRVAVTYRSRRPEDLPDNIVADRLDLSEIDSVPAYVADVLNRFGAIHTLVHAAGPHVPMVHLSRVPPEQFAAQLDDDVNGFFRIVHAALPALRDSRGSVVAVTTSATHRYPVRDGLSAAPKASVEALVRGFAAEEGRFGVRFNAVGPGMLTDGMAERLIASGDLDEHALAVAKGRIPLAAFGTAADIADAVLFLASDRAGYITGQKLDVDGGFGI